MCVKKKKITLGFIKILSRGLYLYFQLRLSCLMCYLMYKCLSAILELMLMNSGDRKTKLSGKSTTQYPCLWDSALRYLRCFANA